MLKVCVSAATRRTGAAVASAVPGAADKALVACVARRAGRPAVPVVPAPGPKAVGRPRPGSIAPGAVPL